MKKAKDILIKVAIGVVAAIALLYFVLMLTR